MERKRRNDAIQIKAKRQRAAKSAPELEISVVCQPEKYLYSSMPQQAQLLQ